jgi:hypothetical protein
MYATTGSAAPAAAAVVGNWASEVADYDYATNTCKAEKMCGHYTQVVWRGSIGVGCAMSLCTTGSPFTGASTWWNVVCNYSPAGNSAGKKPY